MDEKFKECPICKGYGMKEIPLKGDFIVCDYCKGESMVLITEDFKLFWDIPPFLDIRARKSKNSTKYLIIGLILFVIIVVLFLLISFINSLTVI